MIVVDASAMVELLLRTPAGISVEKRIYSRADSLNAPHLIDIEVAQVFRRLAASRVIAPTRGPIALQLLNDLPIIRFPHLERLQRVWQLRDNFSAYDAAYVALAEALDAPLITCDGRLARSGNHHARIELIPVRAH